MKTRKQVKQSRKKTQKKHTTNENKRNQHTETHENFGNIKITQKNQTNKHKTKWIYKTDSKTK